MANYLISNDIADSRAATDGIVVTSTGQTFFCGTGQDTGTTLKLWKSTDVGLTWSALATISVGTNGADYAMFIDKSNNLHVIHRNLPTGSGITYKRYDAPSYTLSVNENPASSLDVIYSPLKLCVVDNGTVYVFYSKEGGVANHSAYFIYRTGVNTWAAETLIFDAGNNSSVSLDVLMHSDGSTIYISRQSIANSRANAFSDVRVNTLVGTTITYNIWSLGGDPTKIYNHWIQEVSGIVRIYASLTDGLTNSADILFRTSQSTVQTLFTSSVAADALRGLSQDPRGINIFYGQTSGALKRRKHNLDGSLGSEVEEIAPSTSLLYGNANNGYMNGGYPRKINNFAGGSGFYGQPATATRFFSSLVDIIPPSITILSPGTYTTETPSVLVNGIASDNVGVGSVTWSNSLGGTGTATGTTSWSFTLGLLPGSNIVTVTAHDLAGNSASAISTINFVLDSANDFGPLSDFSFDELGFMVPLRFKGFIPIQGLEKIDLFKL